MDPGAGGGGSSTAPGDIRDAIRRGPLGAFQLVALGVCVALNMLDGFDVLVMSFTASGVGGEWHLSGAELGLLLSAGLVGMALGALFLAPLADRTGRRPIILTSVWIVSGGMLLSGFAPSYAVLGALRVVTGIGIGGILACATVLIAEYSSDRWRSTASCIYTAGYSLGATVGGTIAAALIARHGWRAAFQFGAAASFLLLPLVHVGLPESVDFLLTRRPADALRRVNRVLARMHHAALTALPAGSPAGAPRGSVRHLFTAGLARATACVWIAFFFMMAGYYFVFGWTPRLLTASGLTAQQGITGGVILSLGGIFGTILFGFSARLLEIRSLTAWALVAAGCLMPAFAMATHQLPVALVLGVALGGIVNGAMAGLYALTPPLYPPELRTTGMGWAIGIGRFGAILAPIGTGALVDLAWKPAQLYTLFSSVFLCAAVALACIGWRSRRLLAAVGSAGTG